jgi:hypothetical protein
LYSRKIHRFQVETTAEQDGCLIAHFNDRRNVGHFNLLFHCGADSRALFWIFATFHQSLRLPCGHGLMIPDQVVWEEAGTTLTDYEAAVAHRTGNARQLF